MSSRFDFDLTLGRTPSGSRRRDPGEPLRLIVIGDFAGRAQRTGSLLERRIHPIDIDDFDVALARIAPRAALPEDESGSIAEIAFDSLESFHPDSLFQRLESLATLRDLRARLSDPTRFEGAARELLAAGAVAPSASGNDASDAPDESVADLTGRLLGRATAHDTGRGGQSRIADIVRRLVEPHIERDPLAGSAPYLAAVDEALTAALRAVLTAPEAKRLEASWRSLRSLVERLELGETILLSILDAAGAELRADLIESGAPVESTQIYRRLVEGREDRLPDLIVLDYEFAAVSQDLRLLAALGALGARVGAPVVAAASGAIAPEALDSAWLHADGNAVADWEALRKSKVAPWIGLAAPRLLLRQPYGPATDAIDAFAFEEIADTSLHEAYAWGNPAYGCALLIGQAFAENGWDMAPGDVLEIEDLPACTISGDEGRMLKPCAEHLLSDRVVERLLGEGLMTFVSYRDRNACRLARFQSISDPAQPLAGPWTG